MQLAFGHVVTPHYRLGECEAIVSLDHDLLGPGPLQVSHAAGWARRRGKIAPGNGRSRMHIAEAIPGLSGVIATTRLPCDPSRIAALAQAFGATSEIPGWAAPKLQDSEKRWVDRALMDLKTSAGKSLFVVGPHLDPQLQAIAPFINERLGNAGKTVIYSAPIHAFADPDETLDALARDIVAGKVDTLIVLDSNPAYAGANGFNDLLKRVPHRIHAGLYIDETAMACEWHLPLSHALEMWGDARAVDGSAVLLQPTVNPFYSTRSIHQLADMLLGTADPASDAALRETWRKAFAGDFDAKWTRALHDGVVADSVTSPLSLNAKSPPPQTPAVDGTTASNIEIAFRPDPTVWDGRFGNIAWLQELPKPLTKLTWDNVVALSPVLAAANGISNGDRVAVKIGNRQIEGPSWIVPGQATNTLALFFGYGRHEGGELAKGTGYDAFTIRPANDVWSTRGTLTRLGTQYPLATTQAHHRMEGFDFVREVTPENPHTKKPRETPSLYADWPGAEHAWGMAIDLDRCIGCNACVSACNVENNVPVVGKDQVSRGREMAWLRIDRYYTGSAEEPRSYFQPVPCMHCESAPCEMGCPVHATVHSPEGVNQQVYNRCIGTRTCSSYCPYKVRRFNWYDYRSLAEGDQAAKNPDVSVRSRGVMEKCTYCTQRIQAAHVAADKEDRALRRDEVVTACQQACPTQAIVFGDLNDDGSAVAKLRRSGRHYALLEELGTRPRTTYLARWNDTPGGGDAG
jgi:molybdopterin-containing oxidoreductase family iron-sulfur binding subunit